VADDLEQRLAGNESVFRTVNEAIESGKTPAEARTPAAFRCECGQLGCNDLIELTVGEYERVRSNPRRFFLTPGHERPEVETVVESHPHHLVVEKRGEAARATERSDPRNRR
jgi:hypothetical protein